MPYIIPKSAAKTEYVFDDDTIPDGRGIGYGTMQMLSNEVQLSEIAWGQTLHRETQGLTREATPNHLSLAWDSFRQFSIYAAGFTFGILRGLLIESLRARMGAKLAWTGAFCCLAFWGAMTAEVPEVAMAVPALAAIQSIQHQFPIDSLSIYSGAMASFSSGYTPSVANHTPGE